MIIDFSDTHINLKCRDKNMSFKNSFYTKSSIRNRTIIESAVELRGFQCLEMLVECIRHTRLVSLLLTSVFGFMTTLTPSSVVRCYTGNIIISQWRSSELLRLFALRTHLWRRSEYFEFFLTTRQSHNVESFYLIIQYRVHHYRSGLPLLCLNDR